MRRPPPPLREEGWRHARPHVQEVPPVVPRRRAPLPPARFTLARGAHVGTRALWLPASSPSAASDCRLGSLDDSPLVIGTGVAFLLIFGLVYLGLTV